MTIRRDKLEQLPRVIETVDDVDKYLREIAERHSGKTLGDLAAEFGVSSKSLKSKQLAEQVACRMLGSDALKMSNIELFAKSSLLFKSAVLSSRGSKTEDMKLLSIDFDELLEANAQFEDSAFYAAFSQSQLMCCVLQEPDVGAPYAQNRFLGFKRIWLGDLIDRVENTWHEMRRIVFSGELKDVPLLDKNGEQRFTPKTHIPMSAPNWPKSSDGEVFVRGTGTDARAKTVEVAGVRMYRQHLWIRGSWVCWRLEKTKWV